MRSTMRHMKRTSQSPSIVNTISIIASVEVPGRVEETSIPQTLVKSVGRSRHVSMHTCMLSMLASGFVPPGDVCTIVTAAGKEHQQQDSVSRLLCSRPEYETKSCYVSLR